MATSRYQNYFSSLFFGENNNFFYQRDFISFKNETHLSAKLKLSTAIGVEKREGLKNHTDFNFLGRKGHAKDNIYSNDRFDKTSYNIIFTYSPRSNYSITDALDMYEKGITPIFNLEYQEGFSSWQQCNSLYRKVRGGISNRFQLDFFNSIDYKIETGLFLFVDKNMHFADYQHFGTSDMLLNLGSLFDSFLMLDNYQLQTKKYWGNLFLNYSGRYVLFKFIPFLQNKHFNENLHFKALYTPEYKFYMEFGYSISFTRYFAGGFFSSIKNTQGQKLGVRFSFNLKSLVF